MPVFLLQWLYRHTLPTGRQVRKGAYSLSGLVRKEMNQNVLSGDVFIFIGKRANKIKLLQWDNDGFALYEKGLHLRLELRLLKGVHIGYIGIVFEHSYLSKQ